MSVNRDSDDYGQGLIDAAWAVIAALAIIAVFTPGQLAPFLVLVMFGLAVAFLIRGSKDPTK